MLCGLCPLHDVALNTIVCRLIIYKVMKYRKILMEYNVYFIFSLDIFTSENTIKFNIFTPPECTYIFFFDYL